MPNLLRRFTDYVYAATRIVIGFLYACHGAQKLFGVLGATWELHDPLGLLAGVIEFFGGSLIALGLFAGPAAFIACGEMAVAYFKAHAPRGFWPILVLSRPPPQQALPLSFLTLADSFERLRAISKY